MVLLPLLEFTEALLNLSADPNAEDQINETPLHYAAFTGHLDCVKLPLVEGQRPSRYIKSVLLLWFSIHMESDGHMVTPEQMEK